MSINNRIQDVAKNAASAPSEGGGWLPAAFKFGAVLLTAAVLVASGDGAEASEVISEVFKN
ncbi:hypothetical protein SD80_000370 [Scytonema tolypothrichoides VB-61278]|nr:hypothetical protein SD80_000370 [Scytonema tolypothrichoides VB-61278]